MKSLFFVALALLLFSFTNCFDFAITRIENYVRQSNDYGIIITDNEFVRALNDEYAACQLASQQQEAAPVPDGNRAPESVIAQ